jgi:DtxR family transcriptional regulator, Mn-dependent transcriptional regulator
MSESEEMYLVSIALHQEASHAGPVPLPDLADQLGVLTVSVNQMVRKLEESKLVTYLPYKGVSLTPQGKAQALRILRHRRLWEVFLVEKLKCLPEEATYLACRLEHTTPCEIAERLAIFLGDPEVNPQGKRIPQKECNQDFPTDMPLTQLPVDRPAKLTQLATEATERSFLSQAGFSVGQSITVIAASSDGNLLVKKESGGTIHLSTILAEKIRVEPLD